MGRTINLLEVFFFILVSICSVIGVTLVFVGGLRLHVLFYLSNMEKVHNAVTGTSFVLLVMGVLVVVLSFVTCCGIYRNSFCASTMCAILWLMTWIIQICWVSYIFTQLENGSVKHNLYESLRKLYQSETELAIETVDYIQNNLRCCGIDGPISKPSLPSSCCYTYDFGVCIPFEQGCWPDFHDVVTGNTYSMAILLGVFAAVQLVQAGLTVHMGFLYGQ